MLSFTKTDTVVIGYTSLNSGEALLTQERLSHHSVLFLRPSIDDWFPTVNHRYDNRRLYEIHIKKDEPEKKYSCVGQYFKQFDYDDLENTYSFSKLATKTIAESIYRFRVKDTKKRFTEIMIVDPERSVVKIVPVTVNFR